MTFNEIREAISNQFSGSVVQNDDLANGQIEINSENWLEVATFLKPIQNFHLISLNVSPVLTLEMMGHCKAIIICIRWSIATKLKL